MDIPGVFQFERLTERLDRIPLAGRRALEECGLFLRVEVWRGLTDETKRGLVELGTGEKVNARAVKRLVGRVAEGSQVQPGPDPKVAPAVVTAQLGPGRPLTHSAWSALPALGALCPGLRSEAGAPGEADSCVR